MSIFDLKNIVKFEKEPSLLIEFKDEDKTVIIESLHDERDEWLTGIAVCCHSRDGSSCWYTNNFNDMNAVCTALSGVSGISIKDLQQSVRQNLAGENLFIQDA